MTPAPTNDPLALGAALFRQWRERGGTCDASVPAPLRTIACLLLDVESLTIVADVCRIDPLTLQRWQVCIDARDGHDADDGVGVAGPSTGAAFAALPPPIGHPLHAPTRSSSMSVAPLTIERIDGVQLHLHGPLDVALVIALLGGSTQR